MYCDRDNPLPLLDIKAYQITNLVSSPKVIKFEIGGLKEGWCSALREAQILRNLGCNLTTNTQSCGSRLSFGLYRNIKIRGSGRPSAVIFRISVVYYCTFFCWRQEKLCPNIIFSWNRVVKNPTLVSGTHSFGTWMWSILVSEHESSRLRCLEGCDKRKKRVERQQHHLHLHVAHPRTYSVSSCQVRLSLGDWHDRL